MRRAPSGPIRLGLVSALALASLHPALPQTADPGPAAPRDSIAAAGPSRDSALEAPEKTVQAKTTPTHRDKEVSRIRLTREDLRNVTAAQGDPFKALGALPGISNQSDLSVRPYVRGGKAEETQVMWEGIPLLQPYHFGSAYSVFNIESLRDLTFHSEGFPGEGGKTVSGSIFM